MGPGEDEGSSTCLGKALVRLADKLETLGTMPFTVLFAPSESQKLIIQNRISYAKGTTAQGCRKS